MVLTIFPLTRPKNISQKAISRPAQCFRRSRPPSVSPPPRKGVSLLLRFSKKPKTESTEKREPESTINDAGATGTCLLSLSPQTTQQEAWLHAVFYYACSLPAAILSLSVSTISALLPSARFLPGGSLPYFGVSLPSLLYIVFFTARKMFSYPVQRQKCPDSSFLSSSSVYSLPVSRIS